MVGKAESTRVGAFEWELHVKSTWEGEEASNNG